ncbi:MAG: hypothetical protein A4E53_01634 [Pelotomaculum sp. PtaB.Bin104]|nr:MAG: hypothetical protein A4E53_01634 [Pelotomaculum sp. PtaB.Bin104]OPY61003.1 MAG: hypothetical protein A4E56_02334 [Pelotomaculum sp. PtaU1.Bin065]
MAKCPFSKKNRVSDEALSETSSETTCESCDDTTCEDNVNQKLKNKGSK